MANHKRAFICCILIPLVLLLSAAMSLGSSRADSDLVGEESQSLMAAIPDSGLRMPARLLTEKDVYVLVWSEGVTVRIQVLGRPSISPQRLAAVLDSAIRGSRLEEYEVEWSKDDDFSAAEAYFSDSEFGVLKRVTSSPVGAIVHRFRWVGFVPHVILNVPDYCGTNLPRSERHIVGDTAWYDASDKPTGFSLETSAALPGYALPILLLLIIFPLVGAGGYTVAILSAVIPVTPIGFRRRIFPWLTRYPVYLALILHFPLALMIQYSRFADMLVDLWSTDYSRKLPEEMSAICYIGPILLLLLGLLAAMVARRLYGPRKGDYVPDRPKGHYSRFGAIVVRVVALAPLAAGVLLVELRGRHLSKGSAPDAVEIVGFALILLGPWIGARLAMFVAFQFLGGRSFDSNLTAQAKDIGRRMGVDLRAPTIDDTPHFGKLYANAFAHTRGRIRVTRKLIDELSPEELEVVIAHEIAHLRQRDMLRGWAIYLGSIAMLWLPFIILFELPGLHGWLVSLPLMILPYVGLASTMAGSNWLSRRRELRADRMSLEATGDVEAAESMLRRLAYFSPVPYLGTIDHCTTHPSIETRVAALRKAAMEMGLAPVEIPSTVE